MEYFIETWTLEKLLATLDGGKLNLSPPYQRNPIWTKTTQKYLIQSIKKGIPIPNIFLHQISKGIYDMVDGQQRTRAIKLYKTTKEIDLTKDDSEFKNGALLKYEIPVTIITKVEADESIEDFYYMVNTSGIKLNRPEEYKAYYFDTKFLKLVENLTSEEGFQSLNIIPTTSQKRMMDRELVEELCALILYGITDKKNQVDKIYESDVQDKEAEICVSKFKEIVTHLIRFNAIEPIKNTRYRQRNDFYTLFGFLKNNSQIDTAVLDYIYRLLLQLEKGIRPSKSACLPLADYAFNCVSQSNSSKARQSRLEILNALFLNESDKPTQSQNEVKEYYPDDGQYFIKMGKYLMLNLEVIGKAIDKIELDQVN